MGKLAKDLVERVGGMGRPPGKIKNDIFQKWSVLGLRADFDFENLILASGFRNMWGWVAGSKMAFFKSGPLWDSEQNSVLRI